MSRLSNLAKLAVARDIRTIRDSNMDRLAKVLVLIAQDVSTCEQTGRTLGDIENDAIIAVRAAFECPDLLYWDV